MQVLLTFDHKYSFTALWVEDFILHYPGVSRFLASKSDVRLDIVLDSIPDNMCAWPLHYQNALIVIVVYPVSIREHAT